MLCIARAQYKFRNEAFGIDFWTAIGLEPIR